MELIGGIAIFIPTLTRHNEAKGLAMVCIGLETESATQKGGKRSI